MKIKLALGIFLFALQMFAVPITFLYTGTGSGSFNGQDFRLAKFSILATADTDNIAFNGSTYSLDHDSASIELAGFGTFGFITATRTFSNTTVDIVGFSRAGQSGADLYSSFGAPELANYALNAPVGPVNELTASLLQWDNSDVITTGGVLEFNDEIVAGTFRAKTTTDGAVPEPATFGLFAFVFGAATVGARLRRKTE